MDKDFWKAAGLRTLYSMIEAFIGCVGTDAAKIYDLNWKATAAIILIAGIATFGRCLGAGLPEVKLNKTLYALDNDPDEEDDIEEVGDGTEYDEEGEE